MVYEQIKDSQVLPGTTYYLVLHTDLRLGDYIVDKYDELQKTAVDCNRGLYILSEKD